MERARLRRGGRGRHGGSTKTRATGSYPASGARPESALVRSASTPSWPSCFQSPSTHPLEAAFATRRTRRVPLYDELPDYGRYWSRTSDLLLVRQARLLLSAAVCHRTRVRTASGRARRRILLPSAAVWCFHTASTTRVGDGLQTPATREAVFARAREASWSGVSRAGQWAGQAILWLREVFRSLGRRCSSSACRPDEEARQHPFTPSAPTAVEAPLHLRKRWNALPGALSVGFPISSEPPSGLRRP